MLVDRAGLPQRRSMLHRWHQRNGARFAEHGGWLMVSRYATEADEAAAARRLGVCDLTSMPRAGLTGAGATDWLANLELSVPETPNRATRQAGGDALVRLSDSDYLLLGTSLLGRDGPPAGFTDFSDRPGRRVYAIPRQDSHCCIALTGARAVEALSKLCAVDFRLHVFADGHVAQTSMAHLPAIVVRLDLRQCPCFLVLVSSVAAEYAFEVILDAAAEFDGTPVGLLALQSCGATDDARQ